MADSSQVRRILHMHPAHRTVGVSGVASSFRAGRLVEYPLTDELAAAPMRVSLVARMTDDRSLAALTAFERILAGSGIQCSRVDLASAEIAGLDDADCAVVFGRGLQIIGNWSAFDADAIDDDRFEEDDGFETEVEVAAAARWHPVVGGVRPFIARSRFSGLAHLYADVTHLLVRKWEGRVLPVAWARQGEERAFCTLLGRPEDFRQSEFVRLLHNALEWARG